MDEQQRPKLRLIRGGKDATRGGDHANPHGIPRPGGRVLRKGRTHASMGNLPKSGSSTGTEGPQIEEPYVDPDPTAPHGMVRPKQFKVIEGGKE